MFAWNLAFWGFEGMPPDRYAIHTWPLESFAVQTNREIDV
jgi:hypothetical protein